MRSAPAVLAAALIAVSASAALAQAPDAAETPIPPAPTQPLGMSADETPPSTAATDLSGLSTRIEQDDAVLTTLRAAELDRENGKLRAIKPALGKWPAYLIPLGWLADL
jgi:hypothetical protein